MPFDATDFEVAAPVWVAPAALRDFRDRMARIDPRLFDMWEASPSCGTPACFHGWAQTFYFNGERREPAETAERLGIDLDRASELYAMWIAGANPNHSGGDFQVHRATHAQGMRVLDHLVSTGEVDWSVARAGQ